MFTAKAKVNAMSTFASNVISKRGMDLLVRGLTAAGAATQHCFLRASNSTYQYVLVGTFLYFQWGMPVMYIIVTCSVRTVNSRRTKVQSKYPMLSKLPLGNHFHRYLAYLMP